MRVLICGGRDYQDENRVAQSLQNYQVYTGKTITLIIAGGASGADFLAAKVAKDQGIPWVEMPANWDKFGKAAGPMRNKAMLDLLKPDVVIAFPGGVGTRNMCVQAKVAKVPVLKMGSKN